MVIMEKILLAYEKVLKGVGLTHLGNFFETIRVNGGVKRSLYKLAV